MTDRELAAGVIAVVTITALLGVAAWCQIRRWRRDDARYATAVRKALDAHAAYERDLIALAGGDMEALIYDTRDDPPLSLTWCDPGDVDRIDELVAIWAAEQGGR